MRRIESLEKQITERVQNLAALHVRQLDQKNTLETARAERRTLLAQLNAQVRDRSQEIDRLKRDEERIARLVRELRSALARNDTPRPPAAGPAPAQSGRWRLPVQGRPGVQTAVGP